MLQKFRAKLNYANVMVTLLAFVVLGGVAYGASRIAANSVGPRQLRFNTGFADLKVPRITLNGNPGWGTVAEFKDVATRKPMSTALALTGGLVISNNPKASSSTTIHARVLIDDKVVRDWLNFPATVAPGTTVELPLDLAYVWDNSFKNRHDIKVQVETPNGAGGPYTVRGSLIASYGVDKSNDFRRVPIQ